MRSNVAPLTSPSGPTPVPAELSAEGALELLPVAALVMSLTAEKLTFEVTNSVYRHLALGTDAATSLLCRELGEQIVTFLAGQGVRERIAWRFGAAVEQRQFDVTLARVAGCRTPRCLITLIDRTGEMRTEESLRREMNTDSLTGLPNRAGFGDLLEARIAAGETNYAVLVIDLDRFGRVNSCLGSMAGDEMLITVARRIKGSLRASDVLGRIGGDEFGVLIAIDEGRGEAERVAGRIRKVLSTPFRLSDFEIRVTCAIGMAFGADERLLITGAEDGCIRTWDVLA